MHASDQLPLSPNQHGVWVAQKLFPDTTAFHTVTVVWLASSVDPEAFAAAVNTAYRETDALRVRVVEIDGTPFQQVDTTLSLDTTISHEPHDDDQIRADSRASQQARSTDPSAHIVGSSLRRRADGGWAWIFSSHNLLFDGYSTSLFTRRVAELYSATVKGRTPPPRWFGNLAEAIAEFQGQPEEARGAEEYWSQLLDIDVEEGYSTPSASNLFTASYDPVPIPGGDAIIERAKTLARTMNTTWPDVLLTSWGLYTAFVDRREYLAIRVPFMMRRGSVLLKTPCAISRALPVVTRIAPQLTLAEIVRSVHQQITDSQVHASVEDHELARAWAGSEDSYLSLPSINIKLFDDVAAFGDSPAAIEMINPGPIGTLDLSVYGSSSGHRRLQVAGHESVTSKNDLYAHATRFAGFLNDLLERPAGTSLYQLRLLWSSREPHGLESLAGVDLELSDSTIDSLVRAQSAATPNTIAAISDDVTTYSFNTLDIRANAFAQLLNRGGVQVGDRVAVMLPRSMDLVSVLMGVLRSGAAYVPIDPDSPAERIGQILEDSDAVGLVTDPSWAPIHGQEIGVRHIVIGDEIRAQMTAGHPEPPALQRPLSPADAAYVIFTSGTTGRPKGVCVSHRAIVNRLLWGETVYPLAGQRVLVKTPFTFDVSVPEIFGALAFGGTLVVATPEGHKDPSYLAGIIRDHEITRANFVPSMAQALLDSDPSKFVTPTMTALAGEAFPRTLGDSLSTIMSGDLVNIYGPTETGEVTFHKFGQDTESGEVVPIGQPVANSTAYVLDVWLHPVPAGVTGELYLGGTQVADGYAGRSALTAERFVADPFADDGQRLYRTGDQVRWNADGWLEYLGRSDDQVKIRGFRIELDEIRSVLEQHQDVSQAAVTAADHPAGGKYLVAYVSTRKAVQSVETSLIDQWREWVASRLPEYMVPALFIYVEGFPTTPNGKLDRNALPTPDLNQAATAGRLPETATESILAQVFRDVLQLDDTCLSVDDDFFRLGGHSLLATRVIARTNAALGSSLSLRDVFDHPTIAELATIVGESAGQSDPIKRVGAIARPDRLPLSYGQQSLWLIDQLGGPGGRYVVPTALHLSGAIDESALTQALQDVVIRHEALRTLIREDAEGLHQVIVPPSEAIEQLRCTTENLVDIDSRAIDERVLQIVQEPFALSSDLPIRAALLKTDPSESIFLIVAHHHAVDEWSLSPMLGDLATAYQARLACLEPGWEPLPVQYADYALWQRALLGDPSDRESLLSQHLDYWRETLVGAPVESSLSLDYPRRTEPSFLGEAVSFEVDAETVTRLRHVADTTGATMFVIFQAATALAVSALGGSDDVVIGSPVGGRTEDGLEDLVGYFINTLPIRHRFRVGDTIADVLERSRQIVLDGFEHQLVPFEQIVTTTGAERSVNRNPIFQVMLTHQRITAADDLHLSPNAETHIRPVPLGAVKTDIDLLVVETPNAVTGLLSYAVDLFESNTVERFVGMLEQVLKAITNSPVLPLAELEVASISEVNELFMWSSGESLPVPESATVDSLLREQVVVSPDAAAVVDDVTGVEWSYAQFDARVNALAQELMDRGVRVGDRIAVMLPRSADLVVTLAAVLRAGAAYVPIDPEYPGDRVRAILHDSAPALLVTAQRTGGDHPEVANQAPVLVDDPTVLAALEAGQTTAPVLARPVTPDDAVFLIFTSGTTGRPKGVELSHRAVVNRLSWGRDALGLSADSIAVFKSGLGFVDAATELFGPLTAGATVVVAGDDAGRDPAALAVTIRRHRVTHLLTVPTLAGALADVPDAASMLSSIQSWVASGEALSLPIAAAIRQMAPDCTVHNFYGSTEVTGDVTATILDSDGTVTIGGPVANTAVRVLDSWLRPVPVGVTGELYVGGVQIADGYVGQPKLTAERFIADPTSSSGERLYRTGDLVRWNSKGQLNYLGRVDDQVKIRGFRIEPNEIGTVLETHPDITAAVVVPADHPAGGKYLVAYVTPTEGAPVDEVVLVDGLRNHVSERLPEFMAPAVFLLLEEFPTTTNGKLDRRALPPPDLGARPGAGRAPGTHTEQALAGIFGAVLRLPDDVELSVEDDFFRLGGHSLLATRVVARTNALLDSALSLRDVFDHPSVAGLAQIVDRSGAGKVPVLRVGELERPGILPVSFGQQALWLIDQLGGPGGRYVVPSVMRLAGDLDEDALDQAVRDVVTRHEALRTLIVEQGGELQQVIVPASEAAHQLPLVAEDFTSADERMVQAWIGELVQAKFDLAADIPIRAGLLRNGETEWVLVLAVHHHAVDEWSFPSLLADLSTAYEARRDGREPGWLALSVQYADYALWQRTVLGQPDDPSSLLSEHLNYWRQTLADAPDESTLALDRPRPAEPTYRGADLSFEIDPETVAGLRRVVDERGVSMFMITQAATALAVSALSGADDVVIGSPVGGRTESGLEDLVGYFVNTLPIRHKFQAGDTIADVLGRTRNTVLDGFAHQAAPFEQITTAIGAERAVNRNPVFQIMLTYRNFTARQNLMLTPGAEMRPETTPTGAVKTDLDFDVIDSPNGVTGTIAYAVDLFDYSTVNRFATVFRSILKAITTDPGQMIANLNFLPVDQVDQVTGWSVGRDLQPSVGTTVDYLLRKQVVASSNAVAVVDDATGAEWSYAVFDARVNALAQGLVDRGVRVGDRVAVMLPRSADLAAALTAVIRAGAAYVPIDPEYPAERVQAILEDAGPTILVTDQPTVATHPEVVDRAAVLVDDTSVVSGMAVGQAKPPALDRPITPDDAVYVIFTSGTTGRPKGVQLSHRAVVNRLMWGRDALQFDEADRVLLKTPFTFDVSVPEFFLPLMVGASIVIAEDGRHGDPSYIAQVLRDQGITSVHFVPSMLQAFLDAEPAPGSFHTVRLVSYTGEALPVSAAVKAREIFDRSESFNLYGPTEAAIEITAYEIDGLGEDADSTPIGRPITNSLVRVLDAWLRPVPIGVTGELYLGGVQLADGYVDRHALTASRFVADPADDDGRRLYRTGDLARWNQHGELEYLGRTDDQVKVRGFRIELEEIQAALERHETVSGAVVIVAEHPAGGTYLAAYITTTVTAPEHDDVLAGLLRDFVADTLPEYMVPATFTRVDVFPTNTSGKLDRRALPTPTLTQTTAGRAPVSDTEIALAQIFSEVLRIPADTELSVDDDFFRLGGDSIHAARLVSSIQAHGLKLTLRDVFELRTINDLADLLSSAEIEAPATSHQPLSIPNSTVLERLRESGIDPNSWVYTEIISVSARVSADSLCSTYASVIEHTDALRVSVNPASRRLWLSQMLSPQSTTIAITELSIVDNNNLEELREAARSLVDITTGTPSGLAYVREPSQILIALAVHSGVGDRASVHRFATDLESALMAEAPPLKRNSLLDGLRAVEAAGNAADPTHTDGWKPLLDLAVTYDPAVFAPGNTQTVVWKGSHTEDEIRREVRQILCASRDMAAFGSVIDEEISVPESSDNPEPFGPFTTTSPSLLNDWSPNGNAEYALLRYHNRFGRRALRSSPGPCILATRIYETTGGRPEGPEQEYKAVIRYSIEPDHATITLLGLDDSVCAAFKATLTTS